MPTDCSPSVAQALADEQITNARAWEALKLRIANQAATFDHFVNMTTAGSTATAQQTGQTEDQQAVTPIRTGAGDTLAASAYPANRAIDTASAGIATDTLSILQAAIQSLQQTAQTLAALAPVLVTSAGGASTPSQTQAKPTS